MEPSSNQFSELSIDSSATPSAAETKKLPRGAMLFCGWPLLLAAVGGLVGGLLGGAAMGINVLIYKTSLPLPLKICFILLTGVMAVALWLFLAVAIGLMLNPAA